MLVVLALLFLVVPLFGAEFAPATDLGLILVPGAAAIGIAGTLSSSIVGRGKPSYSLYSALIVTPVTIGLYLWLIPSLDATGAALASTISYCLSFVVASGVLLPGDGSPGLSPAAPLAFRVGRPTSAAGRRCRVGSRLSADLRLIYVRDRRHRRWRLAGSRSSSSAWRHRMAHRGPDGQRTWSDANAGLAFRRLAIIDLDERSMQPMHLGPWHLVFNGEIYNYRELEGELASLGHEFATEGDGEVLLHAWVEWEESALDRFDGMFAFAIWHDERQELVMRRAIRSVRSRCTGRATASGSCSPPTSGRFCERGPISVPRDRRRSRRFLGLGLMPPIDESFFARVNRLPGAHLLRLRDGDVDVRRYWQPRPVDVPARYEDAVEQLRELLAGLDRAAAARRRSGRHVAERRCRLVGGRRALSADLAGDHRRHAFTARFPGFARDEWRYAHEVAHAASVVEHHAVEPTADGLLDDLDALVCAQEEPFGSTSIYAQWCVMRAARERGRDRAARRPGRRRDLRRLPGVERMGAALAWGRVAVAARARVRSRPRWTSPRRSARAAARVASRGRIAGEVDAVREPRRSQTCSGVAVRARPVDAASTDSAGRWHASCCARACTRACPQLLRYADRNSMAHSREVRLPFLGRAVAEFGLSLPAEFLYRDGVTKAVLRDAVRGLVPDSVLDRRDKVGFEPPQAAGWPSRRGDRSSATCCSTRAPARATTTAPTRRGRSARGSLARSGRDLACAERRALAARVRPSRAAVPVPS